MGQTMQGNHIWSGGQSPPVFCDGKCNTAMIPGCMIWLLLAIKYIKFNNTLQCIKIQFA